MRFKTYRSLELNGVHKRLTCVANFYTTTDQYKHASPTVLTKIASLQQCQSLFLHRRFRHTFTTCKLIQTTKITKITGGFCVNFVVRSPSNTWTCAQNQRLNWLLLGSNTCKPNKWCLVDLLLPGCHDVVVSPGKPLRPVCHAYSACSSIEIMGTSRLNDSCWNDVDWLNTGCSVKPWHFSMSHISVSSIVHKCWYISVYKSI